MKRFLLLVCLAAPLGAQGTPADSASARCVDARFDTLTTANGVGRRRNLATAGQACADAWLARVRVARVDTVIKRDTVRDTVYVPARVNTAPVAAFAVSCSQTTRLCGATDASTDDGGIVARAWKWGDGATSTAVNPTHTYGAAGSYTVTLVVKDSAGLADTTTRSVVLIVIVPDTTPPLPLPDSGGVVVTTDDTLTTPIVAELPRVTPTLDSGAFTVPTPKRSYRIGASLKTALDTAKAGDALLLSGTYTGNYVINNPCGAGWLTLTSAADDSLLPAPGERVDTTKHAAGMPVIQTSNALPALSVYGCNVRLMGIEFRLTAGAAPKGVSVNYGLVWLGDGGQTANGAASQTTLDKAPQHIIMDRVWVHGLDSASVQRCVAMNSGATILSNSVLTNCHASGYDAQGIGGWNGPGPYLIENNEISASTENIMFGGGDPAISGLSPSDITIRRNHVHKERSWHPTMGSAANVWPLKNLVELKNARRVLYENNVFENSWLGGQDCAIVFKSSQASSTISYPWQGTQDITFRWNLVRTAPCGLNLQGYDDSGQLKTAVHTARVLAENNWFDQIGAEGSARLMLFTNDLADIITRNNTFIHAALRGSAITFEHGADPAKRLAWTGNVMTAGNATNGSIVYSGVCCGTLALNAMAGTLWSFTGNTLVGFGSLASRMPPGNTFLTTVPATGGVDQAELQRRIAGVVVPARP